MVLSSDDFNVLEIKTKCPGVDNTLLWIPVSYWSCWKRLHMIY